ncbi:hypothetical protein HQO44_16815 [Rhodococcus fascians]|nr:hypothetical protein [Rhodococcus fascians]
MIDFARTIAEVVRELGIKEGLLGRLTHRAGPVATAVSEQEKDIAFLKEPSTVAWVARLLEVSTSGFHKRQGRSVTT